MRAAFFVGCIGFSFSEVQRFEGSNWSAISTQLHRRDNQSRGNDQSDPESGRAEESSGRQLREQIDRNTTMRLEIECRLAQAEEAVLQHRADVTCVEGDLLENREREWRQHGPKKCGAP